MTGGNPYIRALMRTIFASEAQDSHPYTLLYGDEPLPRFETKGFRLTAELLPLVPSF